MHSSVSVLNLAQKKVTVFEIPKSSVAAVAFLDNDETIATGHNEELMFFDELEGSKGDLRFPAIGLWETSTGKPRGELGERAFTTSMVVPANGKLIATCDFFRGVNVWDARQRGIAFALKHDLNSKNPLLSSWPIWSSLSADGMKLVSYDGFKFIVWDLKMGNQHFEYDHRSPSFFGFPNQVCISRNGALLFVVDGESQVRLVEFGKN